MAEIRKRGAEVTTPPVLNRNINIKGISEYISLSNMGKKEIFPYQGIWIFTGGQGTGKTLNMMHTVYEIHNKYPNAIIVSDLPLFGLPYIKYSGINDFTEIQNGDDGIIFVMDEIQTLYSSLKSKDMDDSELFVWSQNRKNKRVILGTSQRFSRIAKPIREQCCFHIECGRKILCFYRYRVYDGYLYNDDGEYEGQKPNYHFYVPKVRPMLSYDTHFVINPSEVKK